MSNLETQNCQLKQENIQLRIDNDSLKDRLNSVSYVVYERFNNYFTDIGPKIATTIGNTDRNFTDYITKTTSSFKFQTVSETNVYKLLSSLNPCKSTGIDKIPAKIIRISAPIIANSLTRIFNTAIYSETVPPEWKLARVIPLHKNGPRNMLNNYRPISILPIVSKVFEKVLYGQLYDYFVVNNLLSQNQFGFRQFHSTASALLDSTNEWFINTQPETRKSEQICNRSVKSCCQQADIWMRSLALYLSVLTGPQRPVNRSVRSCCDRAAAMLFSTGLSQVVVTELQQCCFQQACRKLLTQSRSNAVFNNLRQTCCKPRKAP